MVGENTVGMKKLEEITLEDIQNYLRKYDCDGVITTKLVEKNNTETLQVFEFDGLYDDTIWVCSIYKNEDNDFYIKTANATSPFNHADGVEYDDEENELFKISTIVAELLSYVKISLCDSIDYFQRQVDFINNFCNGNHLSNPSVITTCDIEHK